MARAIPTPLHRLRRAWYGVLEVVYPLRCASCAVRLPKGGAGDFCLDCEGQLERIEGARCGKCSEPFPGIIPHGFSCPNCVGQQFAFECAITCWQSTGPLREAIHRFKYGRNIHLRLPLAHKLYDALTDPRFPQSTPERAGPDKKDPWLLVPVPLHARRFRERRFNQSLELALMLSTLSGLPCRDLLRRTRYTTAQASLNRQQRLQNLAGAFSLRPRAVLPLHAGVLLVDDVFTTGSTAHECARTLLKAGAGRVIVLTVARG